VEERGDTVLGYRLQVLVGSLCFW